MLAHLIGFRVNMPEGKNCPILFQSGDISPLSPEPHRMRCPVRDPSPITGSGEGQAVSHPFQPCGSLGRGGPLSAPAMLQGLAESSTGQLGLLSFPLQPTIRPALACGMLVLLIRVFTLKPNEGIHPSAADSQCGEHKEGEWGDGLYAQRSESSLSPSQQQCVV